jgi:UDP-N-acetylmuramate--alanine ligase
VTEQADYRASNIRYANTKTHFTVSRIDQENWLEIELNMPGKHNVLNALAAISIAAELELSEDSIVKALSNFAGIGRRCDVFGEININNNQILLIDDYAHHPCEISAITDAVRSGWPERRIVAIFQPHRYSRTRDLFDDFCQALSELDVLILLDVYPAGELPISSADSRALSRSIRSRGKLEPLFVEQRDELKTMLPNIVQDKDVLLILGAGDIGSLSKEIYEANGG